MLQIILIFFIFFGSVVNATDVSSPPEGYTWMYIDEINANFLLPNDWYYLKEKQGKTLAIFLSKEKISEGNIFDTGVSINVFRGNPSAPRQLKEMIDGLAQKFGATVLETFIDPFIQLNTQYESVRKEDGVQMRIVNIVLVNIKTKTSYLIIYESPVSLWEKHWPIGKTIINTVDIKSDI